MDVMGKSFEMTQNSSIAFKNENNQFSTTRSSTILEIFTDTILIDSSQILVDKLVLKPSVKLDLGYNTVLGNLAGGCFSDLNGKEMDYWFQNCKGDGVRPLSGPSDNSEDQQTLNCQKKWMNLFVQ